MDKQQAIEAIWFEREKARILNEQSEREVSDLVKRCRAVTEGRRKERDIEDFTVTMVEQTKKRGRLKTRVR